MYMRLSRLKLLHYTEVAAMSRSASSSGLQAPPAKRLSLLQSVGRHTKASTVQMLSHLQTTGALSSNDSERKIRDDVRVATEACGKSMTPYGPLVQQIRLDAPGLKNWEICHPFAFLWFMAQHSPAFRSVMRSCTSDGRQLRLVIYMDGLVPGNPFRVDKGRSFVLCYILYKRYVVALCIAIYLVSSDLAPVA